MRRWLPRSGLVAGKLAVVAGNLLIPVVLKLNAGRARNAIREYRYYQSAQVKVTFEHLFSIVAAFHC
jgi:hypothetical protein